jgi:hypothetical protein
MLTGSSSNPGAGAGIAAAVQKSARARSGLLSLGDVLQTVALRGQIARFLHSHKDEEFAADGISQDTRDERKI